jgi:hypothetical protein
MTGTSPAAEDRRRHNRARRNARLGAVALGVWFVITMLGIASLGLSHVVPMPRPDEASARLAAAMLALRRGGTERFVVHVLSAGCSCTDRLFAHLVTRQPLAGAEEVVLFVGDDLPKRAAAARAGLAFVTLTAADVTDRYGLEAAPVLLAFDARGSLRYAGGYYDHPAAVWPRDERVHARIASGETPESLPVFGCAVSPRLQASLDPLGLVYPKSR